MASGSGARAVKALSYKSITVQLVVPASALSVLEDMTEITVTRLISKTEHAYPEVTCNVTGLPDAMLPFLQICSLETSDASAPRLPPPKSSESTRLVGTSIEEQDPEGKDKGDPNSSTEKEEESYSCASSVNLGEWTGNVPLVFQWDGLVSTFSEYLDLDGSNWWASRQGSARSAVAKTLGTIQLEWRQGISGKWEVIDAPNGKAELTLQPEKVTQMNFNGFQSRWIVDGERYLHSLARVPTLIQLVMERDPVSSVIAQLPPDKRNFEALKDPTILNGKPVPRGQQIYDAVMMIENILPQNIWDIVYSCRALPGRIEDGEHKMSLIERAEFETFRRLRDPATLAEMRKEVLKAPVRAAFKAIGLVGIPLPFSQDDFDVFMPSSAGEDLLEMAAEVGDDEVQLEITRRTFQDQVNLSHPEYSGGVRISLPSFTDLKAAIGSKRPRCKAAPVLPAIFEHHLNKAEDYRKEHAVFVKIWRRGEGSSKSACTLELKAEQEEESPKSLTAVAAETSGALIGKASALFGVTSSKKADEKSSEDKYATWKTYIGCMELEVGEYCYVWSVDDVLFFDKGRPLNGKDPDANHCVLTVQCEARFGVGVQMP